MSLRIAVLGLLLAIVFAGLPSRASAEGQDEAGVALSLGASTSSAADSLPASDVAPALAPSSGGGREPTEARATTGDAAPLIEPQEQEEVTFESALSSAATPSTAPVSAVADILDEASDGPGEDGASAALVTESAELAEAVAGVAAPIADGVVLVDARALASTLAAVADLALRTIEEAPVSLLGEGGGDIVLLPAVGSARGVAQASGGATAMTLREGPNPAVLDASASSEPAAEAERDPALRAHTSDGVGAGPSNGASGGLLPEALWPPAVADASSHAEVGGTYVFGRTGAGVGRGARSPQIGEGGSLERGARAPAVRLPAPFPLDAEGASASPIPASSGGLFPRGADSPTAIAVLLALIIVSAAGAAGPSAPRSRPLASRAITPELRPG